jgi:uncharacterized repeat protein (TIGR01451 family)
MRLPRPHRGSLLRPLLAAALPLACLVPATAQSDELFEESFTGPTAAVPMRVGGSFVPCLTASTDVTQENVPGCAPGQPSIPVGGDAPGDGALRLTDNANNRSGFAIYERQLPLTAGLRFTFTTYAYNGTRFPGFGAADGISVFLADGSVGAAPPGAFGGSLGYAQKAADFASDIPDTPGVPGGYVGVGIDEFGNFGNDREGRGFGCNERADRDLHPHHISLRGAGAPGTDWLQGYCLLDRAPAPGPLDDPDATDRRAAGVARTFRVEVDPPSLPDGTPNPFARIRVLADMENDGTFVPVLDVPLAEDPPETFEFGVAASTGDGTNIHEITTVRLETVVPLPRFTLDKSHATEMHAGGTGEFTLQAATAADAGAAYAPVRLDDELPTGLTVAALPGGRGWDCSETVVGDTTVRCRYAASLSAPIRPATSLPPLTLPVRVAPDAPALLVNVARLTGPEIPEPVEAVDEVPIPRRVDVGLTKQADPQRITAGDPTGFALVATNHGPGDARDVVVTDTLPAPLRVTAVRSSVGVCTQTATTFRCALGTLRAGASAQITLDVASDPSTSPQTVRNDAVVSTSDVDTDPTNDRASAPVEIVVPPQPPPPPPPPEGRLEVEKRAVPARARPGAPVAYRIVVRNRGSAPVRDVLVVDTNAHGGTVRGLTPSGSCSAATGRVVCRFDELAPGPSVTIRYRTRFLRPGSAVNTVTVLPALGSAPDRTASTTVRIQGGAALRIRKVADRRRVRVGDVIRFRVRVTSLGPEPARRVRVCDRLPRGLLLTSPGNRGRRVVCWTLRGLASGRTRTFTVRAIAVAPRRVAVNTVTARAANARTVRARRGVAILPRPRTTGLG